MIPLDPCGLNSTSDLLINLGVVIFPNPTNSNFEIQSKSEKIEKIEILDVTGKSVFVENEIHSQQYQL